MLHKVSPMIVLVTLSPWGNSDCMGVHKRGIHILFEDISGFQSQFCRESGPFKVLFLRL